MSKLLKNIINARKRFSREEDGTTLVEFAICIGLFLLILFAVLDFARLGYNWVIAEKAMQRAVRIAAVRPPVCDGVPSVHLIDPSAPGSYRPGDLCSTGGGICSSVTRQCRLDDWDTDDGSQAQLTSDEMWAALEPMMPEGTERGNILLTYAYDPRLGFVGGPYIPLITAEIVAFDSDPADGRPVQNCGENLCFRFMTPLSALAANASGETNSIPGTIPFPSISVTLPAEDMNHGMAG